MKKMRSLRLLISSLICPLLILSSCGPGGEEGPGTNSASSKGAGGLGFSLRWEPEIKAGKPGKLSAPRVDCTALGIITITVSVYASNDNHLKGEEFPCSAGQGSVGGISAQSGVRVAVEGKSAEGTLLFRGEKREINITAGAIADAGEITMLSVQGAPPAITAFSIDGVDGTVNEGAKTIEVILPKDTDVRGLIATFITTGVSVQLGAANQVSGETVVDFTYSVIYTVRAEDGPKVDYTVTVKLVTMAGLFKISDTGQTSCYNSTLLLNTCPSRGEAFYGQDANYRINTMTFTDNGDGTVTDNITALMWQQQDDNNTYNWYQATGTTDATYNSGGGTDVCHSLTVGDHADWRLPTVNELTTILDLGAVNPSIDSVNFPGTNSSYYWSETISAGSMADAWFLTFGNGYVSTTSKLKSYYVRCVRGGLLFKGGEK